jgi:hypothetical protein
MCYAGFEVDTGVWIGYCTIGTRDAVALADDPAAWLFARIVDEEWAEWGQLPGPQTFSFYACLG